jgi:hypothetical protein
MIRITVLVTLLLALAGCVIPFGASTGPGDYRSPYFSNSGYRDGPLYPSEPVIMEQQALRLH